MVTRKSWRASLGFICIAMVAAGVTVYASDSITAAQGVAQRVTGPDAICKSILNSSPTGLSEYVPTQSVAEWQSFVAHPPSGVALNSCCAGTVVGGYCWYLGPSTGVNCDTVCATHGGCNATGLTNYVGQFGSNANCRSVLDALGAPGTTVTDLNAPTQSNGPPCNYQGGISGVTAPKRARYTGPPVTNSCAGPNNYFNTMQACSCNT